VAGEIITTELAPRPDAPLSQAVRVGQLVFVSGLTPFTREIARAKGWLGWLKSPVTGERADACDRYPEVLVSRQALRLGLGPSLRVARMGGCIGGILMGTCRILDESRSVLESVGGR
jgi:hypothetical protein